MLFLKKMVVTLIVATIFFNYIVTVQYTPQNSPRPPLNEEGESSTIEDLPS